MVSGRPTFDTRITPVGWTQKEVLPWIRAELMNVVHQTISPVDFSVLPVSGLQVPEASIKVSQWSLLFIDWQIICPLSGFLQISPEKRKHTIEHSGGKFYQTPTNPYQSQYSPSRKLVS
jgi:hypothetical protein